MSIDRGLLQARQDYRNLSINLVLEAVTRTGCTIGFAAVWGVTGAAFGVLVGEVVTAVHARITAMAALARGPQVDVLVAHHRSRAASAAATSDGRGPPDPSGRPSRTTRDGTWPPTW